MPKCESHRLNNGLTGALIGKIMPKHRPILRYEKEKSDIMNIYRGKDLGKEMLQKLYE